MIKSIKRVLGLSKENETSSDPQRDTRELNEISLRVAILEYKVESIESGIQRRDENDTDC